VKEHFHFYGPAYGDKKFDLLVGADVFIYPSRWEGLPFAVVEAMAAGQLCLVTPASDPAGLLAKDEAGVVFPTSVDGIADGIRRAAKLSEDERKALLSQSARIVREEMNWEGIARKVIESYEKAVVPEESK
ncbi:glycosyltransferase family 4 protein, partial [Akkermansiaceae bacterium]|nr:glycosyltransferase family 4 protein [Akkermansiaceae bacterium]